MRKLTPAKSSLTTEIDQNINESNLSKIALSRKEYSSIKKIGFGDYKQRRLPSRYCSNNDVFLCGHNPEVHRWGVSLDENDFFRQTKFLHSHSETCRVIVGIRRTNFHRLEKIFHLIATEKKEPHLEFPLFNILPLANIKERFLGYFDIIRKIGLTHNINFVIIDKDLIKILEKSEMAFLTIEYTLSRILKQQIAAKKDFDRLVDCEEYKEFFADIHRYAVAPNSYRSLPDFLGISTSINLNLIELMRKKSVPKILSYGDLKSKYANAIKKNRNVALFSKRVDIVQKYGTRIENNILRSMGPICKDVFIGPKQILFDLSIKCNTDCVYCRTFSRYLEPEERGNNKNNFFFDKTLDLNIAKSVLKDAKDMGTETIILVGGGEPTLYPHIRELINSIKENGLRFNISTNGILLDKFSDIIADESCYNLTVSMSYSSQKSFSAVRPETNIKLMDKIRKNVKLIGDLKKSKNLNSPNITVLHVINSLNYQEIIQMAYDAVEMGANSLWYQMTHLEEFSYEKLKLSKNQLKKVKFDLKTAQEICKKHNILFPSYIDYELDHFTEAGDWSKNALLHVGCYVGWHFSHINLINNICFCCGFYYLYELTKEKRFKDAWYSDWYARYRNDGLIMHKENPVNLVGKPMYGKYCESCDNHDQNNFMLKLIHDYNLSEFVER
ncbi:MAG: radical SAM protein [archaeon]